MTNYKHLQEMRDALRAMPSSDGVIKLTGHGSDDYIVTVTSLRRLAEEYEQFSKELQEIKEQYSHLRNRLESSIAEFYLEI